jgi:hypothetical protein
MYGTKCSVRYSRKPEVLTGQRWSEQHEKVRIKYITCVIKCVPLMSFTKIVVFSVLEQV